MDIYTLIALYTGLGTLTGVLIYAIFYLAMQLYTKMRTPSQRDEVSELPVMGGFIYSEPPEAPITKIIIDIVRRAIGAKREMSFEEIMRSFSWWYIAALILLAAIVILAYLFG